MGWENLNLVEAVALESLYKSKRERERDASKILHLALAAQGCNYSNLIRAGLTAG